MNSLFISKDLSDDHPILRWCEKNNISCQAYSLLRFEIVLFNTIPPGDWLFFYSQKGVDFLLEQIKPDILGAYKIACFGDATSTYFTQKTGISSTFQGFGNARANAKALDAIIENEHIVFVRAQNSLMSVQKQLSKHTKRMHDLIVYKSEINKQKIVPNTDLAILTSPLNTQAYFRNKSDNSATQFISLGATTRKEIQAFTKNDIHIPSKPNLRSVLELLIQRNSKTQ